MEMIQTFFKDRKNVFDGHFNRFNISKERINALEDQSLKVPILKHNEEKL